MIKILKVNFIEKLSIRKLLMEYSIYLFKIVKKIIE